MRIVRFQQDENSQPSWGWISEDGSVGQLEGPPFDGLRCQEARLPLDAVRLLAPTVPTKIIGVGRNYPAHAAEHKVQVPTSPLIFLKPPSAVIGSGQSIVLPPQSQRVEHEGELAVVIGRRGSHILADAAAQYILGFTAGNDVSARDLQRSDPQWTRGKGFDTFCPLGPWIETELDIADVGVTCSVNGQLRQQGSTREMVFSVGRLMEYISAVMTLEPGDVILTGTPAGVGPLEAGDRVTVTIEGLGTLENPVTAG
jgi:2-keto-4-pentenoate hydratase/2-oxohepta-3-ene-1,7-dioic acid hydratase in catechol pathway